MRFTTAILISALGSLTAAQSLLSNLPKCAQSCFGNDFGSCGQLDFKCICSNSNLISGLSCCVSKTCTNTEQDSVVKLAAGLCQGVGVTIPTSASCASGASATPTGNSTSNASSSTTTGSSSTRSGSAGAASGSATSAAGVPMATAGAMGMAMGIAGLVIAL